MKKNKKEIEPMVRTEEKSQTPEKLWLVQYFTIRRHSRVLYLPLDPTTVKLHKLKKGDILKAMILEVSRRAPDEDEEIPETSFKEEDGFHD